MAQICDGVGRLDVLFADTCQRCDGSGTVSDVLGARRPERFGEVAEGQRALDV
jgi:hypothetical protein